MFNFGLFTSFVQQRFRTYEKDKQLIKDNKEKQEFSKVDANINLDKLLKRAPVNAVGAWASKSQINGTIAQSVKESGTGIGGDRMMGSRA